jgi:hypothetical protein
VRLLADEAEDGADRVDRKCQDGQPKGVLHALILARGFGNRMIALPNYPITHLPNHSIKLST